MRGKGGVRRLRRRGPSPLCAAVLAAALALSGCAALHPAGTAMDLSIHQRGLVYEAEDGEPSFDDVMALNDPGELSDLLDTQEAVLRAFFQFAF
ncbi:hypothetical protein G3N55_05825 [Dissulfurirhabdus thermomarina]|uniref:Uncharacterized protein n=1 Tax=Dissulfurirhabdus thermomarina TaxID=1765737 RepID=A0A6N9TPJ4_DISTH|nr:hypothetical protein [Dissulfurirhabdus thermomarina]NDY42360.1 hypothetical protein [Dissulfurirhabdus thermomarina]NMX23012.1 hypothetical protein [Dissulfurirhabdus thermomarina]